MLIHVAAGVIKNSAGKILIAKRLDHLHQGGLWEFPGGKLEKSEAVFTALKRELHEELGIHVLTAEPLLSIKHDYSDKSVLLDVWTVTSFNGDAQGKEGQIIKWIELSELDEYQFPEANLPVVTRLKAMA
jgi:8-oxo-dGTP diphosphatase